MHITNRAIIFSNSFWPIADIYADISFHLIAEKVSLAVAITYYYACYYHDGSLAVADVKMLSKIHTLRK